MIPDFKTFISESIWSDIQDRSTGETVRKEDDVNHLDRDGLYDYLTSHYKNTNSFVPIYNSDTFNTIMVPFLIQSGSDGVYLSFEENEVSIPYSSPYKVKGLFSKLANEFSLKSDSKTEHTWYIISPKDGSEVTNTFYIYVIDFLIDNIPDSFEKGVKKIVNESIWSDIQDRSAGETIRKEDDVDRFGYEEFFVYLTEHYQPKSKKINEKIGGRTSIVDTNIIEIFIPISPIDGRIKSLIVEMDKKDNSIVSMRTSYTLFEEYTNLERMLSKNYTLHTIKGSSGIYIISKEKPTNRTVIDLIDTFLVVVDNPVLEKIS